ncbi:MAG: deaminase, partial [Thermoplasmata archaeon]|nr:deaminase [Thermoplasmata archaeon]NIS14132.1 deaminase [Thermoplasmata archaeon]NIS21970.1 deaminase [Thermoplasmata archaeon]NIT79832.1 deaminase [Thermoplasmata archaeon]NIU50995.1 deaminase [Thermoplasmata archaeon]
EEETDDDLAAFAAEPGSGRPCLVIPDSRGRVRMWHMLRRWPFWGRFIALVSDTTPSEYLEYLEERNIGTIKSGEDHVDLRRALEELSERYGVRVVRADSGGTLNGVLLKEGLVDELSVLLNASFAGDSDTVPFIRSPPGWSREDSVRLRLVSVDGMDDDTVHLRYEVVR